MHPIYLRVLAFLVCVACLVFGIKFSQEGFVDIESFKKLERLVPSGVLGVLEGENQVLGMASKTSPNSYLKSPKTQTPSLYYRYLLEREETDSDGDTRWVTVKDISESVNFLIEDGDAKAYVYTEGWTHQIDWHFPKRYSKTIGDYRYTEWRIEPEDKLLMYAWAEIEPSVNNYPDITLRFDKKGQYLPIISTMSAGEVRGDLGNSAIVEIWIGVSLIALSLMCFSYAAQIHRMLTYLSLLTVFSMSILSVYGIASLISDVKGGASYLFQQQSKAELTVRTILENEGIHWRGWQTSQPYEENQGNLAFSKLSGWQKNRIADIRINLGVLKQVYLLQISHFPENAYAWGAGIDPDQIDLGFSETEKIFIERAMQKFETTKVKGYSYLWVILGFIGFCVFSYFGFRYAKVKRMIENIPTTASAGVSFGLAEVKGKVRLIDEESLTGPVSHHACVWYRYLIEEHRGSGKNARWVTISDDTKFQRFHCEDREGELRINPDGAEVITRHTKVEKKGDMRYSEWLLKPGDSLYALGMAKVDKHKQDQLILGKPKNKTDNADLFILTNYSEKEIMISKASKAILALAFALSGMFCSTVFYFGMNGQFAATDYLLSGLLAPIFLIFFMLVLHYNDIVFLQTRAQRNWANIQVSLKKRKDLLPRLQKIVEAYKQYEASVFEELTHQREALSQSMDSVESAGQFISTEQQLLKNLKLVWEAYPELKSNEMFAKLMKSLTRLENEIALMRTGFNDAVNEYNTRIESFPDVFLARAFKFEKMDWLVK